MRADGRTDGQDTNEANSRFSHCSNAPNNTRRSYPWSSIVHLRNKYVIFVHIYLPICPNSTISRQYTYFTRTDKILTTFIYVTHQQMHIHIL
jgi:hypothetical protein